MFQVTIVSSGPDQPLFLKWPVLPGKSYKVQFKTNLADPSWQDTAGAWIEGADGYFQDSAPDASQRFYRVVAF